VIPISVYNPTGSGNVHTDKVISGGRQKMGKMPPQFAKAAAAKKAGAKAVPAKKAAAKKAPPFAKKMSDPACPPGSMSGASGGKASGLGAAKKAAKAMGEVPKPTLKTPRQQRALTPGKRTNRITGGTNSTTGSREN
jgi:hypothetical protein